MPTQKILDTLDEKCDILLHGNVKVLIDKKNRLCLSQVAMLRLIELGVSLVEIGEELHDHPAYPYIIKYKCWCNKTVYISTFEGKGDDNYTHRSDPRLLQVFEELGQDMSQNKFNEPYCTELALLEIPSCINYTIEWDNSTGSEFIREIPREWHG